MRTLEHRRKFLDELGPLVLCAISMAPFLFLVSCVGRPNERSRTEIDAESERSISDGQRVLQVSLENFETAVILNGFKVPVDKLKQTLEIEIALSRPSQINIMVGKSPELDVDIVIDCVKKVGNEQGIEITWVYCLGSSIAISPLTESSKLEDSQSQDDR